MFSIFFLMFYTFIHFSRRFLTLKIFSRNFYDSKKLQINFFSVIRDERGRTAIQQMIEEKARVLLNRSELTSLAYYQEEYSARHMTIEAFVSVLLELLNTPEKVRFFPSL